MKRFITIPLLIAIAFSFLLMGIGCKEEAVSEEAISEEAV